MQTNIATLFDNDDRDLEPSSRGADLTKVAICILGACCWVVAPVLAWWLL